MSWFRIAEDLVSVFGGAHTHFGLFDEINSGARSYVANFLRRIGANIPEEDIPELGQERASFSAAAYELAKTALKLQMQKEDTEKLRDFLRTNFSSTTHQKANLLTSERRLWLMALCEHDNIALFEKYFPTQDPLVWHR